ncbi:hypothetical protein EXIGLDRAFT_732346 [Exidia glandulosa HHB12029]|uniref:Uncharacterized protein n=1 Tax=Exidia glandulosa HHB12029 TaxID=1314781 RepID=A0A165KS47_EXIGL|nr:hypothetical protein EXIGLDRAFT_732346 [Exidia glandulosa HHB12029]
MDLPIEIYLLIVERALDEARVLADAIAQYPGVDVVIDLPDTTFQRTVHAIRVLAPLALVSSQWNAAVTPLLYQQVLLSARTLPLFFRILLARPEHAAHLRLIVFSRDEGESVLDDQTTDQLRTALSQLIDEAQERLSLDYSALNALLRAAGSTFSRISFPSIPQGQSASPALHNVTHVTLSWCRPEHSLAVKGGFGIGEVLSLFSLPSVRTLEICRLVAIDLWTGFEPINPDASTVGPRVRHKWQQRMSSFLGRSTVKNLIFRTSAIHTALLETFIGIPSGLERFYYHHAGCEVADVGSQAFFRMPGAIVTALASSRSRLSLASLELHYTDRSFDLPRLTGFTGLRRLENLRHLTCPVRSFAGHRDGPQGWMVPIASALPSTLETLDLQLDGFHSLSHDTVVAQLQAVVQRDDKLTRLRVAEEEKWTVTVERRQATRAAYVALRETCKTHGIEFSFVNRVRINSPWVVSALTVFASVAVWMRDITSGVGLLGIISRLIVEM